MNRRHSCRINARRTVYGVPYLWSSVGLRWEAVVDARSGYCTWFVELVLVLLLLTPVGAAFATAALYGWTSSSLSCVDDDAFNIGCSKPGGAANCSECGMVGFCTALGVNTLVSAKDPVYSSLSQSPHVSSVLVCSAAFVAIVLSQVSTAGSLPSWDLK